MSTIAEYYGATLSELASPRRRGTLLHQGRRFPHRGLLELTEDALVLQGWQTIGLGDVLTVGQGYPPGYGRYTAGGIRGQSPSFGVFTSLGAPLLLTVRDAEPVALLIDFTWLTGTTRNRAWLERLQAALPVG